MKMKDATSLLILTAAIVGGVVLAAVVGLNWPRHSELPISFGIAPGEVLQLTTHSAGGRAWVDVSVEAGKPSVTHRGGDAERVLMFWEKPGGLETTELFAGGELKTKRVSLPAERPFLFGVVNFSKSTYILGMVIHADGQVRSSIGATFSADHPHISGGSAEWGRSFLNHVHELVEGDAPPFWRPPAAE